MSNGVINFGRNINEDRLLNNMFVLTWQHCMMFYIPVTSYASRDLLATVIDVRSLENVLKVSFHIVSGRILAKRSLSSKV